MQTAVLMALVSVGSLSAVPAQDWHRTVSLLEYLQGDYGLALSTHDEAEMEEQRALVDEVVQQLEGLGADGAPYLDAARALKASIGRGDDAAQVAAACEALVTRLVSEQQLAQAPTHAPDLEKGAAVYARACASCHGADGRADTDTARALTPAPASFHDDEAMAGLTPYKAFNTIRFGVPGTAMTAFTDADIDGDTRWAVAFYLFTLRQPACDGAPTPEALQVLATSTDGALASRFGAAAVACLRRVMPTGGLASLAIAQRGLDEAKALAAKGDHDGARQAVVDAYLQGLEPVEPLLKARDASLVSKMEVAFLRARLAAQQGEGLDAAVAEAQALLAQAQRPPGGIDFWSVFFGAMLILLREGFEAVIVVGALLASLKKLGATSQARVVHAGWVSALVVGALAFAFGHALVAGANREWLESVVALAAVGMLLYAALWLNARANVSEHMSTIRSRMQAAVSRDSPVALFAIAFSSVGRESLETALFLEGLATDSVSAVVWGALAGLVALFALVAVIWRVGFVLPMKTLFTASTVLLLVTAVALLGKGLHGLQELGVVGLSPIPFVRVELLGIYPDATSLVPQLALTIALLAGWAWRRFRSQPRAATS